ncbi:hypothetical protein EBS67_16190 [bacterium]|jgi:hypothetical protein|nr:hypothetical protein [bacterium]
MTFISIDHISGKDMRFLNMAIEQIERSGFLASRRMGAALIGNRIYSSHNEYRSIVDSRVVAGSLHAEMKVILMSRIDKTINKNRRQTTNKNKKNNNAKCIYVARIADGHFGCAMPCDECMRWLRIYGIKAVKYTDHIDGRDVLCSIKI